MKKRWVISLLAVAILVSISSFLIWYYFINIETQLPPGSAMPFYRYAITCPSGCSKTGCSCDICGSYLADSVCIGYRSAGSGVSCSSCQNVHYIIYSGSDCTGNILCHGWTGQGGSTTTACAGYLKFVLWNCYSCTTSCITTCTSGDGCCPSGCNYYNDRDCPEICTDECSSGQTRCNGDYKQTCGNYDADSCREWPSSTSGSGNEYCQYGCENGQCKSAPAPPTGTLTLVFIGLAGVSIIALGMVLVFI